MKKLLTKRQQQVNLICAEIEEIQHSDKAELLSNISGIICAIDTDLAIEVMKELNSVESLNQMRTIKVNYGY